MHAGRGRGTHIEPHLRLCLLPQQLQRDPQLVAPKVPPLHVPEVLTQPDVAPDALHHAQAEVVELPLHLQGGHLRVRGAARPLEPVDQVILVLQEGGHLAAAGGQRVLPLLAKVHHHQAFRVEASHVTEKAARVGGGGRSSRNFVPFIKVSAGMQGCHEWSG